MKLRTLFTALVALFGAAAAHAANPVVVLETNKGDIKIELYEDKAPITVKNFLQYVDDKHYDGLIFHRVISNFMIQGGGYDVDLKERKTREPIKNESGNGVPNKRGYIAMARTNKLDSATSQFFINVVDNPFLDKNQYAAFGKVIEGMDVVVRIKSVDTGARGQFE
ncbi:MAG: peptidylprolyl isomerase, partial [Zavarzinella sp.]|nr:peptidylprolyl isomerase [Zavarzinella sp.]